jgi:CRISPR-associated endonuclease Cas2
MGNLEKSIKKEINLGKIQKAILLSVAAVGLLSSPQAASGVLKIFKNWRNESSSKRNKIISINYSRRKLVNDGLLEYNENGYLRLTPRGEKILNEIQARNYTIAKPRRWDKKWRVIIFDIKEERKGLRDKVRNTLINIGFICLQKSVWIYPYDCEDLINLIKADFKIGKDVLYMIVDRVENDGYIKERFGFGN